MFYNRIVGFILIASVFGLAACEPRGQLTTISMENSIPTEATRHTVFVATTRARAEGGDVFGSDRAQGTNYAEFVVSVPPAHEAGQIEWPGPGTPDPSLHFVTESGRFLGNATAFQQNLRGALATTPDAQGGVTLFIHGYNMNFAESLYRFVQAIHDYEDTDIPVLFTWASAATTVGYLYDRDSTLVARDALADVIKEIRAAGAERITVLAHSMGTFLTMEALRQMSKEDGPQALSRIESVVLISPDIDVDVFETQARAIEPLPQPFIVLSSEADVALQVSSSLARDENRLGAIEDPAQLSDLPITVIDVTAFSEARSLNHLTSITSPEVMEQLQQLRDFGVGLDNDALQNEGPAMVQVFDRAQDIVLEPFR